MKENFIREYSIDKDFCSSLIEKFESSPSFQYQGIVGDSQHHPEIKDSMDLMLSNHPVEYYQYLSYISAKLKEYLLEFNVHNAGKWDFLEGANLQRYEPNKGYPFPHFEHNPIRPHRELVFMTYLNTLDSPNGEGGTAFPFWDYTGKPIAGNTLIWPSGFTHLHHGVIHPTETKYIATGWYHWIPED